MREEFTGTRGGKLCFTDEGIIYKSKNYHRLYPYGSMKILKIFMGQVQIVGYDDDIQILLLPDNKQDRKSVKAVTAEAIKKNNSAPKCEVYDLDDNGNKIAPITKKEYVKLKDREFRKRCNVCGTVFCYTMKDIKNSISAGAVKAFSGFGAAANAVGGSAYNAYELNKMGDRSNARITDFEHCPNCHSADLKLLTDEEFERIKQEQNNPTVNSVSAADELKKFKELLDMGVITQEEFETKKKQLLGL